VINDVGAPATGPAETAGVDDSSGAGAAESDAAGAAESEAAGASAEASTAGALPAAGWLPPDEQPIIEKAVKTDTITAVMFLNFIKQYPPT